MTCFPGPESGVHSITGGATTTTAYYGGVALSVNGALSYLLSDGLGSVTAAVSASSGAVTATQLYGPYGSVRYSSGTLPTSYGYTGQRADAATVTLVAMLTQPPQPPRATFPAPETAEAGTDDTRIAAEAASAAASAEANASPTI